MERKNPVLAAAVALLGLLMPALPAPAIQPEPAVAPKDKGKSQAAAEEARPLLTRYCGACHGAKKPKAGLNLAALQEQDMVSQGKVWSRVWERVRSHQMPPPDRLQPTPREREQVTAWIEGVFARHTLDGHADPGPWRPRRLNVREYTNSLRDLAVIRHPQPRRPTFSVGKDDRLRLYSQPPHPCAFVERALPQDTNNGGFDTIGENLSIPPFLVEKYLRCTKILLDEAFSDNAKSSGDFAGPWHLRRRLDQLQKGPPLKNGVLPKSREAVALLLQEFAAIAFRRPVTAVEMEKYVQLFDLAQNKGADLETSIRLPLQAILVSPRFVMLWSEPDHPGKAGDRRPVRPLDDHELASRLSYFLWSSLPDQPLYQLAAKGGLNDPAAIESQVRRMLNERKVWNGLVEGFLCQWLQLDRLERAAPDAARYPVYFQKNLAELMRREMLLFVDAITYEDRSILEFIDADWGFVCQPLAEHYGLNTFTGRKGPTPAEPIWYRWKFPDRRRGGVLTMGVVLTGTSQPLRTSPVARGKWVLETMLGTPPPPPPPDVDNVLREEKAGEKKLTVRQRMELHRASPACASCHRRIDPLGMAFEHFDPIGRWRDKDQDLPIDATGTLTDEQPFKGIEELKALLVAHKEEFTRCFVEHMLTYALGRRLELCDAAVVQEIARAVAQDGYRFSRVVVEVAKSYPFRHRRVMDVKE